MNAEEWLSTRTYHHSNFWDLKRLVHEKEKQGLTPGGAAIQTSIIIIFRPTGLGFSPAACGIEHLHYSLYFRVSIS